MFKLKHITKQFSLQNSSSPDRFINYFLKPNHYSYKDNTKFISQILNDNFTEIILSPANTGKTFNLEAFKYFSSCSSLIQERVDINSREEFFKSTEIYSTHKEHFNKYPMITINLKELDQNNFEDNMEKFKYMVTLQFEQILEYMNNSYSSDNKLPSIDMKAIEEYFNSYRNLNENLTITSCKELSKYLLKATKESPFLIIDDYDYPLINAYKNGFYDDMLRFMKQFINILVKDNHFLNKTVLTGVNLIDEEAIFRQLDKYNKYITVNNDTKYNNCFGDIYDKYDKYDNQPTSTSTGTGNKDLILNNLIMSAINDTDYIQGIKVISDITNTAGHSELLSSIKDKSIDLSNSSRFSKDSIYSYLKYNNLLSSQTKEIKETINSNLPIHILEDANNLIFDNNRKLAYAYLTRFCNKNITGYLSYIKELFEFTNKSLKSKNPIAKNLINDPLSFRNENDFETYLIDIFTLDMTNESDDINIFALDDTQENFRVSNELREFTLIVHGKKKTAVYLKGARFRRSEIESSGDNEELVVGNGPGPGAKKGFMKKLNPAVLERELKNINMHYLESVNKKEAAGYLSKVSTELESAYIVTACYYQKSMDFVVEELKLR